MHPLNPANFGETGIAVQFNDGASVVAGYIVKQWSYNRFICTTDGTETQLCTLAPTLDLATALDPGYCTILVTPPEGADEHVSEIRSSRVSTLEGNVYHWTRNVSVNDSAVIMDNVSSGPTGPSGPSGPSGPTGAGTSHRRHKRAVEGPTGPTETDATASTGVDG